jgi:hypothetical protein
MESELKIENSGGTKYSFYLTDEKTLSVTKNNYQNIIEALSIDNIIKLRDYLNQLPL